MRVVIIGAGFGGLQAAKRLRNKPGVEVTVVDRHNYHTFFPLLYEVASAGLEPDQIAQPVRAILRGARNVRFRMADVTRIDTDARCVLTDTGALPYDALIVAAGSTTNHFGVVSAGERALGLKDLREATAVRNRILRSFERAALLTEPHERARLMTMVVIGGGPTGVELAGALAELKRHVLPRDYPDLDLAQARVILLEATDRVLSAFPPRLQRKAIEQLEALGVEVRLASPVADVLDAGVRLGSGEIIESANVVWVAGVRGQAVGSGLAPVAGPLGRVPVLPTMQLATHPEVYVVGDLAAAERPDGRPYPMLAPVAMQQAEVAADNIVRAAAGKPLRTFRYRDRGTMATVGRRMAVAKVFGLQFTGFAAWALWLGVHLIELIGLRNRVLVLVNWTWNYFRYDRANRLVTDDIDPFHEPMAVSWDGARSHEEDARLAPTA